MCRNVYNMTIDIGGLFVFFAHICPYILFLNNFVFDTGMLFSAVNALFSQLNFSLKPASFHTYLVFVTCFFPPRQLALFPPLCFPRYTVHIHQNLLFIFPNKFVSVFSHTFVSSQAVDVSQR